MNNLSIFQYIFVMLIHLQAIPPLPGIPKPPSGTCLPPWPWANGSEPMRRQTRWPEASDSTATSRGFVSVDGFIEIRWKSNERNIFWIMCQNYQDGITKRNPLGFLSSTHHFYTFSEKGSGILKHRRLRANATFDPILQLNGNWE